MIAELMDQVVLERLFVNDGSLIVLVVGAAVVDLRFVGVVVFIFLGKVVVEVELLVAVVPAEEVVPPCIYRTRAEVNSSLTVMVHKPSSFIDFFGQFQFALPGWIDADLRCRLVQHIHAYFRKKRIG